MCTHALYKPLFVHTNVKLKESIPVLTEKGPYQCQTKRVHTSVKLKELIPLLTEKVHTSVRLKGFIPVSN